MTLQALTLQLLIHIQKIIILGLTMLIAWVTAGVIGAEDTPSNDLSVSGNNRTGHVYNQEDLAVRNNLMRTNNPLSRYIQSQEAQGN